MKQINTLLFTCLIISLLPFSSISQNYYSSAKDEVNNIDIEIRDLMAKRKTNQDNQKTINEFVDEVDKWFKADTEIKNKIKQAKSRSGNYSTFSNDNLQQEIQNLERQQKSINTLKGGTYIIDKTYYSLNELQDELTNKGFEIIDLINEDEKIHNQLQTLDSNRDKIIADLENDEKTNQKDVLWEKIQHLENKRNRQRDNFNIVNNGINSPSIWCSKANKNSKPKCIHRNLYISTLAELYVREIRKNGKEYNENELATLIKNVQQHSNEVKEETQQKLNEWQNNIVKIEAEINTLKRKYWANEEINLDIDPSGCWVIIIGNNYPTIRIKENSYGDYVGTITNLGSLHQNYNGRTLFNITRINATTFEGTEYSYSDSGRIKSRTPLRIIINENRNGINYRTSDDILNLRPCR